MCVDVARLDHAPLRFPCPMLVFIKIALLTPARPASLRPLSIHSLGTPPSYAFDVFSSQARRMAAVALTSLATVESNHPRIRDMHPEILVAAARDSYASDLLLNGLKSVFHAP